MRPSFYRRLWRFNAILIAILGLITILISPLALSQLLYDQSRHSGSYYSAGDSPSQPGDKLPRLSNQERIKGTPYLAVMIAPTGPDQATGLHSSPSSHAADRNILLIDLRTGASRSLMPDNKRRIIRWETLSSDGPDRTGTSLAYVALVGDDSARRYDVLIGSFATGQQAWVARGVSALDAPTIVDDAALGLLLSDDKGVHYHLYGLDDLKERVSRPVPLPK